MNGNKHFSSCKVANGIFVILSLTFMLLIHGAIPFLSMPTLGQAIWSTGFAQSLANQSVFDLYAINFGNPKPAAMSFGLAGAYPASLFIRLGFHPADAYTLMTVLWLLVAYLGAWKISRGFNLTRNLSILTSLLWMSMPIIWGHAGYSMVSLGIGLMSFYFYSSLRLFQCFGESGNKLILNTGLYISAAMIAVFMDGYSFMMFAVGSSFIGGYLFLRISHHRAMFLKVLFPIHFFSFLLAYILYTTYIGKTQFDASPLDFFRGFGADLMFLAIPSKGVYWLWDALGFSVYRSGTEQFGDSSVWSTTFALPIISVGLLAWFRLRKSSKFATGFLLIALFGFYMGLGPSIKINSVKTDDVYGSLMEEKYSVLPTGSALLSTYVPGFTNMRAAYRWTAIGFFGFWLLIVLLLSRQEKTHLRRVVVISIVFLIVFNLPHMGDKGAKNIHYRKSFIDIEKSLVKDLNQVLLEDETVAFLPYRNDFFVNYLASRLKINTYNIGGDKNLAEAKKHWPETMRQFKMGSVDVNFVRNALLLLARSEVDSIVLPHIDLLWAAHNWPSQLVFRNEIGLVASELRRTGFVTIDEREYYTLVRLTKNLSEQAQLELLEYQIQLKYCLPPDCVSYQGTNPTLSQVGAHTGFGMQTGSRAGYLMFGPYHPLTAGEYILKVTGKLYSNGDGVIVDVTDNRAGKIYASYKGLGGQSSLASNVLLEQRIILDVDATELEVRVLVDNTAHLLVDGYSLRPVNSEKYMENE